MSHVFGKLGRRPARRDARTLSLASYLTPELPPAPASVDFTVGVPSWPMLLNDSLGCCTVASAGHLVESWTEAADGAAQNITDGAVLQAYEAVGGYVPGDPSTDQGADELTVLKYWRKVGIGGHKIVAFVAVDPANLDHVKQATALLGGLYLGVALPKAWQGAATWDVGDGHDFEPGSWGGHAVPVVAYDQDGVTVVTWGRLLTMTWAAFAKYVEEAWAIISPDWIAANGDSPQGFALTDLKVDLALLEEPAQ